MAAILYIQSRLRRGVASGLCVALLLGALGWFSCLYFRFLEDKAREMEAAYEQVDITVVISNIQGTQTDDLGIFDYILDCFLSDRYVYQGVEQEVAFSSYVRDVRAKATLFYGTETAQRLVGLTCPEAAPELSALEGTTVYYLEGWDAEAFGGEAACCLVPQAQFETLTPDGNGIFWASFSVREAPVSADGIDTRMPVMGYYSGEGERVYCSWSAIAALYRELGKNIQGDSLSATVRDNRKLEEFRELLGRYFGKVDPAGRPQKTESTHHIENYYHFAATVHDETLRQTLNELNRNLLTLRRLLPLVLALEWAVAFAACAAWIQARRRELAVARSLGARKREVLAMLLAETLFWSLVGMALALVLPSGASPAYGAMAGVVLAAVAGVLASGTAAIGSKGTRAIKEVE